MRRRPSQPSRCVDRFWESIQQKETTNTKSSIIATDAFASDDLSCALDGETRCQGYVGSRFTRRGEHADRGVRNLTVLRCPDAHIKNESLNFSKDRLQVSSGKKYHEE